MFAVQSDNVALVNAVLARKVTRLDIEHGDKCRGAHEEDVALLAILKASLDALPADTRPAFRSTPRRSGATRERIESRHARITMTITAEGAPSRANTWGSRRSTRTPGARAYFVCSK